MADRLLGLLLLILAAMLAWWWTTAIGLQLPTVEHLARAVGLGESEERLAATKGAAAAGPAASEAQEPAVLAPFCPPGEEPRFVLGFADLREQVGAPMGEPLECEHTNPDNGDALQSTTTGLAYYRYETNTPTFTDGWRHWALTPNGLVYWEGDSADPPPELLE